jgi:hypothetical protein
MNAFIGKVVEDFPQVNHYHTDTYTGYTNYFKQNNWFIHTTTKNKTTKVESFNSILRGNNPSLFRKTKVVNRSNSNLYNRIYTFCVLYNRKIKSFLDFKIFCCIFVKSMSLNGVNTKTITT